MAETPTPAGRWRFEWRHGVPSLLAPPDVLAATGVHNAYLGGLGWQAQFRLLEALVTEANGQPGPTAGWVVVKRRPMTFHDFRSGQTVRLTTIMDGVTTTQVGVVTVEAGSVRLGLHGWIDWHAIDIMEVPAPANPQAEEHRAEAWRRGYPDQRGGVSFGWDCLDCTSTAADLADALAAERGADWHSRHPHGLPPTTEE